MLFVDSREGSVDLVGPLRKAGLPAELTTLKFADVMFEGKGVGGHPIDIGIELKELNDLCSSLRTGRLSGVQLPGLVGENRAYDFAWLVIEGEWRTSTTGQILTPVWSKRRRKIEWLPVPGDISAYEMMKRVLTLEVCGGLHVRFTNTRADTVAFVGALYRWFTDKPLDHHTSHLSDHLPHGFIPLSDFRQVVRKFPGVGLRVSAAAEKEFHGCIGEAVGANTLAWSNLETKSDDGSVRKIGSKTAAKIHDFLWRRTI